MKKIKFSKRTKNIGIISTIIASATAVSVIKDQVDNIKILDEENRDLLNKIFDSLNYELELESFIVNRFGEEILKELIS